MADKPVTREEKYLAYLTGDYTGELPKPITRKEKYLYELCLKGIGGEISSEEIKNAVNEYLEKNPVKPGATTEQAQQIEQNKTDIASLKTETGSLKEDLGNVKAELPNVGKVKSVNGKQGDVIITSEDIGYFAPEETINNTVKKWLNDHPEATTTVQNDSIDIAKFTANMQKIVRNFADSIRRPLVSFTSDDSNVNGDINIMGEILKKHNVPATCAVITGESISDDKKNAYLNMQNNYGWEIASHSIDATLLETLSEEECDTYLRESKRLLVDAGFNVNGIVYPSGSANQNVRRLAKKYYQYGCNYNDRVNVEPFLDSFSISRVPLGAFYTNPAHNTFAYYKECVDNAVANNGWCVFCLHPYKDDFDETQQRYLDELIDYIESLNIEMVTLSEGYKSFGNIIEVGKSFNASTEDEYERFVVTNDGRTNLPIYYAKGSSILSSMIPTDFRDRCITICNVSKYADATYPDSSSGIIVTMRLADIFVQLWFPSNSSRIYRRTSTSKTSSGTFSLITPILVKTGINNNSATQPIGAYTNEQITVTEITNGSSLGFPKKEGTLITKKLANYTSQIFIPATADDELYTRRWDMTTASWTKFINVLRNKVGKTYTYLGMISTNWNSIPVQITSSLYIKTLKSTNGRTLDIPKQFFVLNELSTDKDNPTVIASSNSTSLTLQAYIDDEHLYFKYNVFGNNYVALLEIAYQ